jgi:hypothetical protein
MSDPKQPAMKIAASFTAKHEDTLQHPAATARAENDPTRRNAAPVEKTPELVQRVIERVKKM